MNRNNRLNTLIIETPFIDGDISDAFELNVILFLIILYDWALNEVAILFDMHLLCDFFFDFHLRTVINFLEGI